MKRYEERLVEDMQSPYWKILVGEPPLIYRLLPTELLLLIIQISDVADRRSLRW
jgi:hypothetical protein